jgi:thiol-disulfide isomerase/thioredoxin
MKTVNKIILKSGLLVLLAVSACKDTFKKDPEQAVTGSSEITINKVKLAGLDGQSIDFSKYAGKTIFINFWATWCKPCVSEMPSLQSLTGKLKEVNIVFFFASDEASEEIEKFKNAKGHSMEFVKAESLADLNIMGLPTTFIFDKNGKLVFSEMGARQWDSEQSIALVKQFIE